MFGFGELLAVLVLSIIAIVIIGGILEDKLSKKESIKPFLEEGE